jgi:endonuclease/exonuclease/phosphatase family metal-dependent hydrolase
VTGMQVRWLRVRYILLAALLVLLTLLVLLLDSRRPIGDYSDPDEPFYEGYYANAPGEFEGKLRVVAWNLHYGEKVEQAIEALENVEELREADVLLFQELDVEGVELIARRLQYNYIFYPAAFHRQRREEYGNAILSKWPLKDPAKIVLPNWLTGWLQSRNAARATILVEKREILVYSVHLDTVWMAPVWARTQGEFLIEEVGKVNRFVILGGDFNTWSPVSIKTLENGLAKAGLVRLTKGTGYTFVSCGIRLPLDHIFSRDLLDYRAGVYRQTDASDHYPVWVELAIDNAN